MRGTVDRGVLNPVSSIGLKSIPFSQLMCVTIVTGNDIESDIVFEEDMCYFFRC